MMSEKTKVIILLTAVATIGLLGHLYFRYLKHSPQDYTVGTATRISKPANGGRVVEYEYLVDKIMYKEIANLEGRQNVVGKQFIVSYPEGKPGTGFILFEYPVPDSIVAPEEGWDELPAFAR